jgi:hypothetical protein
MSDTIPVIADIALHWNPVTDLHPAPTHFAVFYHEAEGTE